MDKFGNKSLFVECAMNPAFIVEWSLSSVVNLWKLKNLEKRNPNELRAHVLFQFATTLKQTSNLMESPGVCLVGEREGRSWNSSSIMTKLEWAGHYCC